jgi:hypothetical protein
VLPIPNNSTLADDVVVYRAYSRKLDEDGRVQFHDFVQRDNEETLSVALTPAEALDELDVRGYVPITVGDIRAVHEGEQRLRVLRKAGEPMCCEITGITRETATGFAISLSARAALPVPTPEHRVRIRAKRETP